uniref:CDGSH iron-sulfur domain-containing protein n=1 Tax=Geomonas subterranea TaxID=2847989 RepID=UPI001CD5AFAA|nr:CDGSH iron-sulfur domain-containing protein [Geomonas fuzhouensis]
MSNTALTPNQPIVVELEAGTYHRCTCGKSSRIPFCDGAHVGSNHAPVSFEVKEKQQVYLCNCGKTDNAPYCDGSCRKQ